MELQIEYVRPETLTTADYNPRTISDSALRALARLIDEHGFVDPVIARRRDGLIVGGHQRIRANAMRSRPDELIPCIFVAGLDDTRAKALNVALNNPEAQGSFDDEMLSQLLSDIEACDLDTPALTGFSADQVEELTALLDEFTPLEDIDLSVEVDFLGNQPDGSDALVVLVFEIPPDLYRKVRPEFDELISRHALSCHVRASNTHSVQNEGGVVHTAPG